MNKQREWGTEYTWVVVSFFFHPYLGKIPNLTNIFQRGWNHQVDMQSWVPLFFLVMPFSNLERSSMAVYEETGKLHKVISRPEPDRKPQKWSVLLPGFYHIFHIFRFQPFILLRNPTRMDGKNHHWRFSKNSFVYTNYSLNISQWQEPNQRTLIEDWCCCVCFPSFLIPCYNIDFICIYLHFISHNSRNRGFF